MAKLQDALTAAAPPSQSRLTLLLAMLLGATLGVVVTMASNGRQQRPMLSLPHGAAAAANSTSQAALLEATDTVSGSDSGSDASSSSSGPSGTPSAKLADYYVIALASGLPPADQFVFMQSWRRHSPATKLVLYGDLGELAPYYEGAPWLEVLPVKKVGVYSMPIQRLLMYGEYLQQLLDSGAPNATGIVLSDSRDTFIQSDPWQDPLVDRLLKEDAMLFSLEGGGDLGNVSINEEETTWNKQWVQKCFGDKILEEIGVDPVSCSGVTIGSLGAVFKYVSQMVSIVTNAAEDCQSFGGADQGIHNYVLHYLGERHNKLDFKFYVRDNLQSPVHTSGYGWPVVIDRFGVYRRPGSDVVPSIVHQYDREESTVLLTRAMYPYLRQDFEYHKKKYVPGSFSIPNVSG